MPWQPSIRLRDVPTRTNRIVSGCANYPLMVKIPRGMVTVKQGPRDRMVIKQWNARQALKRNPFAWAMNLKLRMFYRDSAQVVPYD